MMDWDAFFKLHHALPREGPGQAADVAWAMGLADLPEAPLICDLGCGPGADTAALLDAVPDAEVLAIEAHGPYVDAVRDRFQGDPRVKAETGDMAQLPDHPAAPFDAIWCAGALYFLGLEAGPATMARALRPGGVLAFSEPAFFTEAPSDGARAFWDDYPTRHEAAVAVAVRRAGFRLLGQRQLADAAWEAYFAPIDERIAGLRAGADAALAAALDAAEAEAAGWRTHRAETGYTLVVARRE